MAFIFLVARFYERNQHCKYVINEVSQYSIMSRVLYPSYLMEAYTALATIASFEIFKNFSVVPGTTISFELFKNSVQIRLYRIVLVTIPCPHNVASIRADVTSKPQHSKFALQKMLGKSTLKSERSPDRRSRDPAWRGGNRSNVIGSLEARFLSSYFVVGTLPPSPLGSGHRHVDVGAAAHREQTSRPRQ
jgi:hypothetical protein